jgi:hypothetical protein
MFATVDESIKEQRLTICYSCESFINKLKTCNECKCYMPAKALFAETECPMGKWGRSDPGDSIINQLEESILKLWDKS